MENFSIKLTLRDSLDSRKKNKDGEPEVLPKEIQHKMKMIEKAFRK